MADIAGWFVGQRGWVRFPVLAAIGVAAGLGQAPFDLWPVTLVAFAVMLILSDSFVTSRTAGAALWVFGIGYFGFSLRWIVEPFLVDIGRHGWMAPFALVLMATGAGFFWALAGWFAARFRLGRWGLVMALAGVEVLRSLILTGFPWALLGHIWIDTWVAQLAGFGGPHLLTLVTVVASLALAGFVTRGWRIVSGVALAGLAVVASNLAPPLNLSDADGPIVRMVQPNAPQSQKWDPAYRDLFLNRAVRLTAEGDVPDFVVWPETSVPYLLNYVEDDLAVLSDAARGAPIVFGIQRFDDDRNFYNSLVLMEAGAEITAIYDKHHLVPFGEFIPGARLLGDIGFAGLVGRGFTPGTGPASVEIPGIGSAVPLICYEGIFAEEIVADPSDRRLLLLITNDAWFGKAAGPLQHVAQARLRAIEQGLPMVRVANTGVSAMIDPYGRITASLPLGAEGALDARLPPALAPTLYAHFGDLPVIAVLLVLLGAGFLHQRRVRD